MNLFQKYRLFFGLYSKNIATFYELEAFRGNESRVSPIVLLFLHKCIKDVDSGEIKR